MVLPPLFIWKIILAIYGRLAHLLGLLPKNSNSCAMCHIWPFIIFHINNGHRTIEIILDHICGVKNSLSTIRRLGWASYSGCQLWLWADRYGQNMVKSPIYVQRAISGHQSNLSYNFSSYQYITMIFGYTLS